MQNQNFMQKKREKIIIFKTNNKQIVRIELNWE